MRVNSGEYLRCRLNTGEDVAVRTVGTEDGLALINPFSGKLMDERFEKPVELNHIDKHFVESDDTYFTGVEGVYDAELVIQQAKKNED